MPLAAQEQVCDNAILSDHSLETAVPLAPVPRKSAIGHSTFARHVLLFSVANLLFLVCNGVLTFVLPRLLSMETYGYYRLFMLYGGFVGVLHLGQLDGALIRWAARPRRRMRAEVLDSLTFLIVEHAAILLPATAILAILFYRRPWFSLVVALALYAVIFNVTALGQFALQAEKFFGLLSFVTVLNPALLLAAVVGLHYGGRLTLGTLVTAFVFSWLLAAVPVWGFLLGRFSAEGSGVRQVWRIGVYNIRVGWSVLLAGLLTNLALLLDRIVVSLSFGIRDFAIYSLAATALAVVNTIILSVSRVVFPYLSDGLSAEKQLRVYGWGESCLITLWAVSLAGYFPLRALIEGLLPAYVLSLPILRLLMLATGLTAAIYILHANYFRSSLRQGSLLLGATVGLLAAALFLALARRSGSLVNMSWAVLAAVALWWTVDELLLRELTHRTLLEIGRTMIFTLACGGSFLLCALITSNWLGPLAYCGLASLLTAAAYGQSLRSLPGWGRWSTVLPKFGSAA